MDFLQHFVILSADMYHPEQRVAVDVNNPITKANLLFWKFFTRWSDETILEYLELNRSFFNKSGRRPDGSFPSSGADPSGSKNPFQRE